MDPLGKFFVVLGNAEVIQDVCDMICVSTCDDGESFDLNGDLFFKCWAVVGVVHSLFMLSWIIVLWGFVGGGDDVEGVLVECGVGVKVFDLA